MMSNSDLLIRAGAAASVVAHLAVLACIIGFAGVRPFDVVTAEPIAVNIVTPDEMKEPPKAPEPEPLRPTLPDTLALPEKTEQTQPSPPQPAQQAPPAPASKSAAKSHPAAAQHKMAAAPPAPTPPPPPPAIVKPPEPDLSVKYPVNFGLPLSGPDDFDALAARAANVSKVDITAFRDHLKTCATLPGEIAPGDKVVIKLRANFSPDGRLAAVPILIEASASAKGPLLMQAAIEALLACQPYAALPADKYDEWKVLDLSFTPQDFKGG